MKQQKSGLTMVSIIIYVALFFVFIAFAISISTNMNYKNMAAKGNIYINEQYNKLQYNLFKSAKVSSYVNIIQDDIVFSNNDIYHYDSSKRKIYKNNAILVDEVDNFSVKTLNNLNITDSTKYVSYTITFSKYNQKLDRDLFVAVGDNYGQ